MTTTGQDLLARFETLEPDEKREVAAEILRRTMATDAITDNGFADIGASLFQNYDQEESGNGQR